MHLPKLTELYEPNMYHFLIVNHTAIKWFKKKEKKLLQKQALPFMGILTGEGELRMPALTIPRGRKNMLFLET